MATKIESELTPEQVVELLVTLANTPGGDKLRIIKEQAAARGVEVSLMAAKSFKESALTPYLQKLKDAKAKSQIFAEVATAGDETGMLSGARLALAEKVSDFLLMEEVTPKQFTPIAMALQMLSSSNQGEKKTTVSLELAKARLREYEAKDEERREAKARLAEKKKAIAKKGGLSKEAIELMEETFELLG